MTLILPPLWPATLPTWPVPSSVVVARQPSRVGFAPERGLRIERPGSTAAILVMDMRLPPVTRSAAAGFWTFYEATLKQGALRFAWVHPLREVLREVTILEADGSPAETDIDASWSQLAMRIAFLDVQPWWAAHVTIAGGILEQVSSP